MKSGGGGEINRLREDYGMVQRRHGALYSFYGDPFSTFLPYLF